MKQQAQAGADRKRKRDSNNPQLDPRVQNWLEGSFRVSKHGGIPCEQVYGTYVAFCTQARMLPAKKTIFGKYLKQVFPEIVRTKKSYNSKRVPEYLLQWKWLPPHFRDEYSPPSVTLQEGDTCSPSTIYYPEQKEKGKEKEFESAGYLGGLEGWRNDHRNWGSAPTEADYKDQRIRIRSERQEEVTYVDHQFVMVTDEPLHDVVEGSLVPYYYTREDEDYDEKEKEYEYNKYEYGYGADAYWRYIGELIGQNLQGLSELIRCRNEQYCWLLSAYRSYIEEYAQILWPMLPLPWIIVNGDVIEHFALLGETELDVMTLNVAVAIFVGAGLARDIKVSMDMYLYALNIVSRIHDSKDMNMVAALVFMASHAFMLFEPEKGFPIALNLILIAESTCEACNARDSEIYGKVLNLKFWLTRGESNVIMPEDTYCLDEHVDSSFPEQVKARIQKFVNTRRASNSCMAHKMYLEKVVSLLRNHKAKQLTASPQQELQAQEQQPQHQLQCAYIVPPDADETLKMYKNELKRLRRNGRTALAQIKGTVHPTLYLLQVLCHNSTVSHTYNEMGNHKKALKFAKLCLDQLASHGSLPYFFYLKECPRVLSEAGGRAELKRFALLAETFCEFNLVAKLRDTAESFLNSNVPIEPHSISQNTSDSSNN